jgi:hypothetical protein
MPRKSRETASVRRNMSLPDPVEFSVGSVLDSMHTIPPMGRGSNTSPVGRRILARLRTLKPFVEGSLTVTTKRCGRPTCRCATTGPLHPTALLTWKEEQTTRTLYIPVAWRDTVAAWVEEGKRLKDLSHAMSVAQRQFLLAQRRRRPR